MTNAQRLCSALSAVAIATLALAGPALAQQPTAGTMPAVPDMPMHSDMPMQPGTTQPGTGTPPGMPMPAMSSPAAVANMAAMNKMSQTMSASPMTGNPDRDFVGMMMPHHQGAIDMAQVELKYGKDPVLRKMATAIVAAQETEIAEMKAWQAKHPTP